MSSFYHDRKNAEDSWSQSILVQPAYFPASFRLKEKTVHLYKYFQNRLNKTPG
jgi:hypothetical protein